MKRKPEYGNWIRKRAILILGLITLSLFALGFIPWHIAYRITMFGLSGLALLTTIFIVGLYWSFSPVGGNYQSKIHSLIIKNLNWDGNGTVLDIGASNGALIISIAGKHPGADCIGLDYWGKDWEYSRKVCEKNAEIEGVQERVTFVKGSAAALPYENEHFDAVVSNLTFHEVRDVKNKAILINEAVRVLKPGGHFSFIDPFFNTDHYGSIESLSENLDNLGLSNYTLISLSKVIRLTLILKHRKVLGLAGVLYGTK